jgi:hypothetical protein
VREEDIRFGKIPPINGVLLYLVIEKFLNSQPLEYASNWRSHHPSKSVIDKLAI